MVDLSKRENGVWGRERGDHANTDFCEENTLGTGIGRQSASALPFPR